MLEHEKLKEICDKIWYEFNEYLYIIQTLDNYSTFSIRKTIWKCLLDVREIIFTQEFMDKYWEYLCKIKNPEWQELFETALIFNNLNNPVEYLYNLLELWKHII